jgi:hypothetical protein
MRGKSVEGNTDTGMVNARYAPTAAITNTRNINDCEFLVNQYALGGWSGLISSAMLVVSLARGLLLLRRLRLLLPGFRLLDLYFRLIGKAIRAFINHHLTRLQP